MVYEELSKKVDINARKLSMLNQDIKRSVMQAKAWGLLSGVLMKQVRDACQLLIGAQEALSDATIKKQFKNSFGDNTLRGAVVDTYVQEFLDGDDELQDIYGITRLIFYRGSQRAVEKAVKALSPIDLENPTQPASRKAGKMRHVEWEKNHRGFAARFIRNFLKSEGITKDRTMKGALIWHCFGYWESPPEEGALVKYDEVCKRYSEYASKGH